MADVPLSDLLDLPPEALSAGLPAFLAGYGTPDLRPAIVAGLEAVREGATGQEWRRLQTHLLTLGDGFEARTADPLAARIGAAFTEPLLAPASSVTGLEHLDAGLEAIAAGRRLMIVGNHLSYTDTTVLGHLLLRAGRRSVRAMLWAVAGPKVYSEPMRRMAAAGLNLIQVAQSARVATGQTARPRREIARIARHSFELAEGTMDAGRIVLIYPEGTRSRSGRLQPFLRATTRWVSLPGVVLLPSAVWGSEALDRQPMHSTECHGRFGPLIDTEALRAAGARRADVLAAAHEAVAALLPADYRPETETARIR